MLTKIRCVFILIVFSNNIELFAQSSCPTNIGFENGSFLGWTCYSGSVYASGGKNLILVSQSLPISNTHTIISTNSNAIDPYGKFSIKPQNNSNFVVKLGNDKTGALAERVSYTFKVPNDDDFSIKYRYAVVLEDPGHPDYQQPRFTAKVVDVSTNKYIECASFEYIATANLPGFKLSTTKSKVYYKTWTPVSINLSKYKGKNIRLEFSTADCTQSAHFGYAYLDIDEECANLIKGNSYCGTPSSIKLTGPEGYEKYLWFNKNFTQSFGTGNPINIYNIPPDKSELALVIVPYPGFGCQDTIYTTINRTDIYLKVNDQETCYPNTINLTDSIVTQGSSQDILFSYWTDNLATIPLANPDKIDKSGIYYIKGYSGSGCEIIKPINVNITPFPNFVVKSSITTCYPNTIDLTSINIKVGSDVNKLSFTYWQDNLASIPIDSPESIQTSGNYFIKATSINGCELIKAIKIDINPFPDFITHDPATLCYPVTVDLTDQSILKGSDTKNLTFSYWLDSLGTKPNLSPNQISVSGTYFIKASTNYGCFKFDSVRVLINPKPVLSIFNPSAVCAPEKIDITLNEITKGSDEGLVLSYWEDSNCSIPILNPKLINKSGTYYIKATAKTGCETVKPIIITIYIFPTFIVNSPPAVCEPETINLTLSEITNGSEDNKLTYTYWLDSLSTKPITNPKNIFRSGTYYIKATSIFGCFTVKSIKVIINPLPILNISNPQAVCFPDKVNITLPEITKGSDEKITLTYWQDLICTIPLENPKLIDKSGTYFIKATSLSNCSSINSVEVFINPIPKLIIQNPTPVYEPNTIDITSPKIITTDVNTEITFWEDEFASKDLREPNKIDKKGYYYVKSTNNLGCYNIQKVYVFIALAPNIMVPKAFTPLQVNNNKLFPLLYGIEKITLFKIFNKWGDLVFDNPTMNPEEGWDGNFKGQIHFFETYSWYAEGIDELGKKIQKSGNTILLK